MGRFFCVFQSLIWAFGLHAMTVEEKVGQLFVVPLCPSAGVEHFSAVEKLIREYHIGGVILKAGTLAEYRLVNEWLDRISPRPILKIVDAEWGLGMRISDAPSFPKNEILGKYGTEELAFEIGKCIAKQMKELKLDVSLGPVIDVFSNPDNPIITARAFGSDADLVSRMGIAMIRGLQEGGVIACAKHFPGHGDVDVDSHLELPVIRKSMKELHQIELVPFQKAIEAGVTMIMTAHLAFEDEICPMSKRFITDLLRDELGFKGVIISDALNMKGIANRFSPEEIALSYLQAGHDLLLYGDHIAPNIVDILDRQVPLAFDAIVKEVKAGRLNIDDKVERILQLK